MNKLKLGIVSCGYLGLSPFAPGTAGTLGGVAIAWLLRGSPNFLYWILAISALLYVVGRSLGRWSEEYAGGEDPGFFVLDEVIGYLITVAWIGGPSLVALVVAFFLFRLLDVVKPPPARALENLGGGDGILLDDVMAGIYGLLVMAVLRHTLLTPDQWVYTP